MRKLFVIICSVLFPLLLQGQTIHTVLRGETAASIAQKYGVSEEELSKANPKLAEFCYVGMQLTIPAKEEPAPVFAQASAPVVASVSLSDDASAQKREHRKKVLKSVGAALAVTAAVVGTAMLVSSASNSGVSTPSYTVPSYSPGYSSDVSYAAAAAQADAEARMAIQQSGMARRAAADQNLQRAMQQIQWETNEFNSAMSAVNDVFMPWFWEYQQNPTFNPEASFTEAFTEKHGRGPTMKELEIFRNTFAGMYSSSSDGTESASSASDEFEQHNAERNARHQERIDKIHEYYDNRYGNKDCHLCHGSGTCQTCLGNGWYHSMGNTIECPNCLLEGNRRTGKCRTCRGTGQVYGIK